MEGFAKKYFLQGEWQDEWGEATQQQFVAAERAAGFHPKAGCGPVATGGFSGGGVRGRIEYAADEPDDAEAPRKGGASG